MDVITNPCSLSYILNTCGSKSCTIITEFNQIYALFFHMYIRLQWIKAPSHMFESSVIQIKFRKV